MLNRRLSDVCVGGGVHCVEQGTVRCGCGCVCVCGGGCIVLNRGLSGVDVCVCVWGGALC